MPEIPSRIIEIADELRANKQPRRRSVRSLLKWFGAKRRGANVIKEIQDALQRVGMTTDPDLAQAHMDERLSFMLTSTGLPSPSSSGGGDSVTPGGAFEGSTRVSRPDRLANSELQSEDYLEPEPDEDSAPDRADDRPVLSQPCDWNIAVLRDKHDRGQLNLQPRYQRDYVWELRPELPSRLIESLLLEIPIPPIYFGKMPDGRLEVIDGQQRLTTLMNFASNKFRLQRLQQMPSLNQKYFRDLEKEHQEKILDAPIRSVVIDAGKNSDLRYQIFERLNRGSMALNEQELRNCVFRGPFNELLEGLEKDQVWRRVRGSSDPEPRFKERETILRFFAFANRIDFYTGKLKRFLNEHMERHAPSEPYQIEEQATMFRQTMQNIYAVFGANSARLYISNPKTKDGKWDTKFSVAALDIQASALMHQPPAKVQIVAEQIREQFLLYLLTSPELQEAISGQTAGTKPTRLRWTGFRLLVQPILDGTITEPRFFDYQFRRQLYDKSPACAICGNEIHSFDDSTVDHKIPYSKGGKTVPENGQLAHRTCNAIKNMSLG